MRETWLRNSLHFISVGAEISWSEYRITVDRSGTARSVGDWKSRLIKAIFAASQTKPNATKTEYRLKCIENEKGTNEAAGRMKRISEIRTNFITLGSKSAPNDWLFITSLCLLLRQRIFNYNFHGENWFESGKFWEQRQNFCIAISAIRGGGMCASVYTEDWVWFPYTPCAFLPLRTPPGHSIFLWLEHAEISKIHPTTFSMVFGELLPFYLVFLFV